MIIDVGLHMALEAIGGAIMIYALSYCNHKRHQFLVWFILAAAFSLLTVIIVG